ncbi:MAG TPA: GntR family transcriptional regulator [Chloroflexota bacterium]
MNMSIDLDSYEPAYVQLANILRRQIAAGIFRPGDRLPSETELCERYRLSRMTVRRVINLLSEEGAVRASQGRGTFVRPWGLGAATFRLQQLQDALSDEDQATVKMLEARILPADSRVARKLAVPVGEKVIYIRRLLYLKGQPAIYHREYLIYDPRRPVVETEMEATSLRGFFDGSDATGLKRGDLSIEVAMLTDEEAAMLSSPSRGAFNLEHVFYDFDDHPASWGWFLCRSDRLRFVTSVGASTKP